ncbi:MAG: HU family DNA-binding protein [Gammaproteobacteria bacterium]
MNRSDLVSRVFQNIDSLNKSDVELGISSILEKVSNSLEKRDRVEVRGFGTFSSRKRNKRISRNPSTGSSIAVTEKYHPYFRASKSLKAKVNK